MTLISRILGFARDVIIARVFGASVAADAFFVAFKIPNLFRRLFAEGAFSQAFVPVLAEYKETEDHATVARLIYATGGSLGLALIAVVAIGVIAAPVLIIVFAPGFLRHADKLALGAALLRLTFPYLMFVSLTALAGAILNTYGRFAIPAITPALLNVALISAALWLAPKLGEPIMALAYGVLIGGVLQLGLQLWPMLRLGFPPRPTINWRHPGVQKILRLMLPAMFGVSVAQINLMLDTLIASFLRTGSISWLYYSDRLVEFPLGVFGIALGTVILPSLSERHAQGESGVFSDTLDWAMRWVLVIAVPATAGLVVLAGPMLSTLFQYGAMTVFDVNMASLSLMAYSAGLTAFIFIKILAPGYYARQDTRTPVRIGVIAMLSNMVLNLILVVPLAHAGLALATSLAAYLNAALLLRGLRKVGVYRPKPGWGAFLARIGIAALAMTAVLILGVDGIESWSSYDAAERGIWLAAWIGAGAGIYFVSLYALGLRPGHMVAPGVRV
jgi:putative peptidoglycan lipid II flippase